MIDRSKDPKVINPVLGLPAAQRLTALPDDVRAEVAAIFKDLSVDARERAQASWKRNKGPMAVYWKAIGAYCTHIYRVLR